jgi:acetyl-CoA synthetase
MAVGKPSYRDVYRSFDWASVLRELEWEGHEASINLGHTIVDRHAQSQKVALYWLGKDGASTTLNYRDLKASSDKFANLLRSLGVTQGDRIAGMLPRIPETLAIMIGTWKAGGVYVPIFSGFGRDAIAFRIKHSGAKIVCTHDLYRGRIPDLAEHGTVVITISGGDSEARRPGDVSFWDAVNKQSDSIDLVPRSRRDPAVILYTSGSTGEPKGVQIASNFLAAVRPFMKYGGDVRPGDMFWPTGDPGWGWGFVCCHAALAMGVPVVSHEAAPTAELFVDLLERRQVTNVATVPTILRAVMAQGTEKLASRQLSLRCISSCGEPLNAEVVHFFQKTTGVTPCDQYGSSENGLPVGNFNALDTPVKAGSMGNPMPGHDMAVVDDQGMEVGVGTVGYIALRPSREGYYSLGYWDDAERTQALFRNGWMIVGDLARRDEDGYFWFEGRADDLIKTSGYRVGPFEIESAILHHPQVAEAAVVGKPDGMKGQIVMAFITLKRGAAQSPAFEREIQDIVRERVGNHAFPREVVVVDVLPKTESGKIQRFKLRADATG